MIAFEIGKIQIKLQSFFPISTRDRNEFLSQSSRFPRTNNFLENLNPFPKGTGIFCSHKNYFKFNLYFVI